MIEKTISKQWKVSSNHRVMFQATGLLNRAESPVRRYWREKGLGKDYKKDEQGRFRLRAHHLTGSYLSTNLYTSRSEGQIVGMYGIIMYDNECYLRNRIDEHPDAEVEIIDDFDDVCKCCIKRDSELPFELPVYSPYPEDDRRNPLYWVDGYSEWRNTPCDNEIQRKGDREDASSEWFGLPIGSIITARQAKEISRIHQYYFSDPFAIIFIGEKQLKKEFKKELMEYYRKEQIANTLTAL